MLDVVMVKVMVLCKEREKERERSFLVLNSTSKGSTII